MEGGPPQGGQPSHCLRPCRNWSPIPSSVHQPHQERPGSPLCLPRTCVYRSSDGSPEGRAQDRLGQPCVSTGRRDESLPQVDTRSPSKGEEHREARKEKKDQRRSRPRGLAEGPALSLASVPVPSSTAWAAVELSPATTSLRSIAFSPRHVGSLFFILFFLAPWDIKLASCFFGLPLPPFG